VISGGGRVDQDDGERFDAVGFGAEYLHGRTTSARASVVEQIGRRRGRTGDLTIAGTGDPRVRVVADEQIADSSNVTITAIAGLNVLNRTETIGALSGSGSVYMGGSTPKRQSDRGQQKHRDVLRRDCETATCKKVGSGVLILSGSRHVYGDDTVSQASCKSAPAAVRIDRRQRHAGRRRTGAVSAQRYTWSNTCAAAVLFFPGFRGDVVGHVRWT